MLELVCMRVSMKIVSNVRKYVLVRVFVYTIRVAAMQCRIGTQDRFDIPKGMENANIVSKNN